MKTSKELKQFKRELRRKLTESERYVLIQLGKRGIPFKYQIILGFYITDFLLTTKMVNIEVDGGVHNDRKRYDALRDNFIRKCGFSVIRIKNEDIYTFDYDSLFDLKSYRPDVFARGLSLGNIYRGRAKQRERNEEGVYKLEFK